MGNNQTFGQHLRELRQSKNLSQRDLAEQVATRLKGEDGRGFTFTYLSKIENDRLPPPSAAAIRQLAAVLESNADDLMALAGKPPLDLGRTLQDSPAARAFFRSARDLNLTEEDWRQLVKQMKEKKEE